MSTRIDYHNQLLDDLVDRKVWETRQRTWYQMRHNGIRRARKPGPWASDMHFPLADTIIGKLKPYYFEQLYAPEMLATFVSLKPDALKFSTSTARWFDYQLKQKSNLETEILSSIDTMLASGRSAMKVCWENKEKELEFHAINPLHLIVPKNATSTTSHGRFVHVRVISRDEYLRCPKFTDKTTATIDRISGSGVEDKRGDLYTLQEKFRREGITYGATKDEIVIWECYELQENGQWYIHNYSPLAPLVDLAPMQKVPYRCGYPPVVDFYYEIKDKGWYSPRGICELVAPHEASLCRLWNEKHDTMTFFNRPYFQSERDIPNAANLEFHPGQILPFGIKPTQMPNPPISFDQEMLSTRQIAEQRVAVPDYGMNQVMSTRDRRTATEVAAVSEVMGNASDLRMRIFRKCLSKLYRLSWEILKEFKSKDLAYFYRDEALELESEAFSGEYEIMPHGSADGVSRVFIQNKAVQRFQMFNGDPLIDQAELRRSVLEADDSNLAPKLLVDPQTKAASQEEDQADEISILNIGFKARVLPTDDHVVHIQTCVQYLISREKLGIQYNPVSHQAVLGHMSEHLAALQEQDPKAAREVEKALAQVAAVIQGPNAAAQPAA